MCSPIFFKKVVYFGTEVHDSYLCVHYFYFTQSGGGDVQPAGVGSVRAAVSGVLGGSRAASQQVSADPVPALTDRAGPRALRHGPRQNGKLNKHCL